MGNFEELNKNMNDIMVKLIENQNLCKLLKYNTKDCLSQPSIEDTTSLLHNEIFPYPFSTETLKEASSLLIVTFDKFTPTKGYGYKNNYVIFRVLCNNDLWSTDDGLRPYLILHELDTMFNDKKVIGIGKLIFNSCNELWANKDYTGFTLTYKVTDFN